MDTILLISIIVVIVVIYFFVKFIVSPVIKAILGFIIFLVAIYLLQKFLGLDLNKILSPYAGYLNKWGINLNWILETANYYIDKVKTFLYFIWNNFSKSTK